MLVKLTLAEEKEEFENFELRVQKVIRYSKLFALL